MLAHCRVRLSTTAVARPSSALPAFAASRRVALPSAGATGAGAAGAGAATSAAGVRSHHDDDDDNNDDDDNDDNGAPHPPQRNVKLVRKVFSRLSLNKPGTLTRPVDPAARKLLDLVHQIDEKKRELERIERRRTKHRWPLYKKTVHTRPQQQQQKQQPHPPALQRLSNPKPRTNKPLTALRPVDNMNTAAAKQAIADAAMQYAPTQQPLPVKSAKTSEIETVTPTSSQSEQTAEPDTRYVWTEWAARTDLSHWERTRLQWLERAEPDRQSHRSIDEDEIYDALVAYNGNLPQPVPLPDFLKVLTEVWFEDGVFNPPEQ